MIAQTIPFISIEIALQLRTTFLLFLIVRRQFVVKKRQQILLRGFSTGERRQITRTNVAPTPKSGSEFTLRALLPLVEEKADRKFLDKALEDYRDARKGLDDLAKPSEKAIHPQYLAQQISHFAADDAIFTCDVGTPTVWAARYLKMNGKRRLLGSFNHGSMANAMPQALGAQATEPERQVVAMCGDGGFSMLMGDFLSDLPPFYP